MLNTVNHGHSTCQSRYDVSLSQIKTCKYFVGIEIFNNQKAVPIKLTRDRAELPVIGASYHVLK